MDPPPSPPVAISAKSSSYCGRGSTARSTGGPFGIPRVPTGFAETILGGTEVSELRRVCFPEYDRARVQDALNARAVGVGNAIFVRQRTACGSDPLRHLKVFQRYRQSMQRTETLSPRAVASSAFAACSSASLGRDCHICVELRIYFLDACEVQLC